MIEFVSGLPDFESPKYGSKSFNQLSYDILRQKQINEMDDLTRYSKKINDVYISLVKPQKTDSSEPEQIFINQLLDSLNIDRLVVERLRAQLIKTKLREFFKSNDSILFRVDGYMGNSYGYFYSAKPMRTGVDSFNFINHWVTVYEDVNENWKKATIYP